MVDLLEPMPGGSVAADLALRTEFRSAISIPTTDEAIVLDGMGNTCAKPNTKEAEEEKK